MPPKEGKVWTNWRKVAGNLVPLLLASPLLYWAMRALGASGPSVALILWLLAFLVAAWVFLALTGLFANGAMRREVGRRLHLARAFDKTERYFVGFARPVYKSALDPHEDVGFLLLHPDRLEFWGSEQRANVVRESVVGIRLRPNTHTLVGLGRWISVEAVVEGKAVRLLVEPREKATLVGNLLFSKRLLQRLRAWREEGPQALAQGPT
jgi:hypothetical protein